MSRFGNTHVVRHLEFSISLHPFPSQNLPILLNFSSLDNRNPSLIKLETLGMSEVHIRESITVLCPRCQGSHESENQQQSTEDKSGNHKVCREIRWDVQEKNAKQGLLNWRNHAKRKGWQEI